MPPRRDDSAAHDAQRDCHRGSCGLLTLCVSRSRAGLWPASWPCLHSLAFLLLLLDSGYPLLLTDIRGAADLMDVSLGLEPRVRIGVEYCLCLITGTFLWLMESTSAESPCSGPDLLASAAMRCGGATPPCLNSPKKTPLSNRALSKQPLRRRRRCAPLLASPSAPPAA